MNAWGLIEFIAIALLIPGCAGALIIAALVIVANDTTHRHCADPDGEWESLCSALSQSFSLAF